MDEIITLDYGSGGKKTARLIENLILPALDNPALRQLGDGALLPGGEELVFSTDSFVVDPIFFPGGDIGKLAVCGTVNDIAMCGGEPKYLSCSLILEEGLPVKDLERVIVQEDAAWVPLFSRTRLYVTSERLADFQHAWNGSVKNVYRAMSVG